MSTQKPIERGGQRAGGSRLGGGTRRALSNATPLRRVPESERFDPSSLFESDGPIELEVGCGKGAFLVLAAAMYPNVRFIGVEIAAPFARAAAERMVRHDLENVRILHGDAGRFVTEMLVPGSLEAVHVFFPDPWPKKRHRKRRVFTRAFLEGVYRVLAPGGMLCLATDFVEYYAVMCALADAHEGFERRIAYAWRGEGGVTNFERKYLRAGRTSHRAAYRRRVGSRGR